MLVGQIRELVVEDGGDKHAISCKDVSNKKGHGNLLMNCKYMCRERCQEILIINPRVVHDTQTEHWKGTALMFTKKLLDLVDDQ